MKAWSSRLARGDDGEVLVDDVARRTGRPLRTAAASSSASAAHGASRMRGTRNRPSSAAGAMASTSSRSRLGRTSSARSTLTSGSGCAVGGTSLVSSAATCARVLEDHLELRGEVLDLVVGEREPGQLRDVLDVGAREPGHGGESRSRTLGYDAAVPTYPFLSDEWLAAVRAIVDARDVEIPPHAELSMNLVVTETPFAEDRQLHIAPGTATPTGVPATSTAPTSRSPPTT